MSEITVVIPTYNRVGALLTCLEHLERQSFADFDVVVVDDGSTDGTGAAIERYMATTLLRMRYAWQENGGPARARNRAIAMMEAPICLMIGDDIFADRELVAMHLRFHEEHPEGRMAALGWTRWSETGQAVTPFMRWLEGTDLQFSYAALLRGKQPGWGEFFTSNLSLKTDTLRRNPFDERFRMAAMEDIELGFRLARRGELEIVFLPEAMAWHLHPTSFEQACRRLEGVGAATHLFHELWPEQRIEAGKARGLRGWMGGVFHRNGWILNGLRRGTSGLVERWCPNPLMERVLRAHAARGYRRAGGEG